MCISRNISCMCLNLGSGGAKTPTLIPISMIFVSVAIAALFTPGIPTLPKGLCEVVVSSSLMMICNCLCLLEKTTHRMLVSE